MKKILIVDDEEMVLSSLRRLFRKIPDLEVISTTQPKEALNFAKESKFAIVLSDQRMPEMEGDQLLSAIKEIQPNAIRIILTGYSDREATIRAINDSKVHHYLTKPWAEQELLMVIRESLKLYQKQESDPEAVNDNTERIEQETRVLRKERNRLAQKIQNLDAELDSVNLQLKKNSLETARVLDHLHDLARPGSAKHSRRVTKLAVAIANELGIKNTLSFWMACFIHDIGEVAIDPEITVFSENPNAVLTHARHVLIGESLAQELNQDETVSLIVRHHHENFDGSGYPDGLQGEQIPLLARILRVADAYDNELSALLGKVSTASSTAFRKIEIESSRLFDPEVVETLKQLLGARSVPEIEVALFELTPGMVLSRPLKDSNGRVIAASETRLGVSSIDKVHNWLQGSSRNISIFVYDEQ